MTANILDEIVAWKRIEIERCQVARPLAQVQAEAEAAMPPRSFAAALRRPDQVALIAEIKRRSPSKGPLCPNLDPTNLAQTYEAGGTAAISVLTDERFFGGSLADLRAVRQAVNVPLLRKDFVLDAYQVYEARAAGSDAVLLIAAILDDQQLAALYALTDRLGMSALIEVHSRAELERALRLSPRIIGINNRNLETFTVDIETTAHLRPLIPDGMVVVAESGIHTRADVDFLRNVGVDAMLVGEALVRAGDVRLKVQELLTGRGFRDTL